MEKFIVSNSKGRPAVLRMVMYTCGSIRKIKLHETRMDAVVVPLDPVEVPQLISQGCSVEELSKKEK